MKCSTRFFFLLGLCSLRLPAHPMGNFSVSHYAKFVITDHGVEFEYALDLAEIPTLELLQSWNLNRSSPVSDLHARAVEQGRVWFSHLTITLDGRQLRPVLKSAKIVIADGAGNLPIVRITTYARIDGQGSSLSYEDHNFPERAGWKEIVIAATQNVAIQHASQSSADISHALTQYPPDPTTAPPQDLRAEAVWSLNTTLPPSPVITRIAQPANAPPATPPALMTARAAPLGAVTRADLLSRMLQKKQFTIWMLWAAIGIAFLLGAAHALTPGHGKTIVAAYLVGSRGTLRQAAFLGGMVTFTHTFVVFVMGLATLFLFRYIVPEKITQILGAVSGLSIVLLGAWMLYKRVRAAQKLKQHIHEHHRHGEHHHHHHHSHDGHSHSHPHMPEDLSWGGLIALGASGGLVPCESALVLLLGAIAMGRVGLGLLLLTSFSLGLATVLMAIGVLVLYAKNLIPERSRTANQTLFRWISVVSPTVVMIVGVIMTGVSLGLLRPGWAFG